MHAMWLDLGKFVAGPKNATFGYRLPRTLVADGVRIGVGVKVKVEWKFSEA